MKLGTRAKPHTPILSQDLTICTISSKIARHQTQHWPGQPAGRALVALPLTGPPAAAACGAPGLPTQPTVSNLHLDLYSRRTQSRCFTATNRRVKYSRQFTLPLDTKTSGCYRLGPVVSNDLCEHEKPALTATAPDYLSRRVRAPAHVTETPGVSRSICDRDDCLLN